LLPGRSVTASAGCLGECRDDVGIEGAHLDVGGAFAEFEGADNGVGNDTEADAVELGCAMEIVWVCGRGSLRSSWDWLTSGRGRSDGMAGELGGGVARDDADGGAHETGGKRGERRMDVKK